MFHSFSPPPKAISTYFISSLIICTSDLECLITQVVNSLSGSFRPPNGNILTSEGCVFVSLALNAFTFLATRLRVVCGGVPAVHPTAVVSGHLLADTRPPISVKLNKLMSFLWQEHKDWRHEITYGRIHYAILDLLIHISDKNEF